MSKIVSYKCEWCDSFKPKKDIVKLKESFWSMGYLDGTYRWWPRTLHICKSCYSTFKDRWK